MAQEDGILGRSHGDAERLFPRKTNAYAAATAEVTVNGKVLKIWEFAQLETLSNPVLRQRAMAIRDAVGEANCPPIPSSQSSEMIRWILHMQAELASQKFEVGIPKPGRGCAVPAHFMQEAQARPIQLARPASPRGGSNAAPFGPRTFDSDHRPLRDSYRDLVEEQKEFADVEHHLNLGIQSMRPGGEGRRHITPATSMVSCGVSTADPQGIQTMKKGGEGRRYLACKDSLSEQKHDVDAQAAPPPQRPIPDLEKHVSHTHMKELGVAEPVMEPHIGGERRRRGSPLDHMVSIGISGQTEDPKTMGRRHLDSFGGSRHNYGDSHDNYQSNWKKDPSKLKGTSLII